MLDRGNMTNCQHLRLGKHYLFTAETQRGRKRGGYVEIIVVG
jgi:hypothetical protein